MSIEVRPVGVTCNLRCSYCYEQPVRDIEPVHRYNKAAVLAQLSKVDHQWSLFGGEALLVPLPDLEELLQIGFERWGGTGVQTNGTLITSAHIDLFEKYHTHIGMSLDGPDELNDSRWAGTVEATRKMTARTFAAIDMLLDRAATTKNTTLIPSLIITLHAGNASVDRWPRMREWLLEMDRRGIAHINFHVMELDHKATKGSEWYLPHDRLKEVMLDLWDLSTKFVGLDVANFREIVSLLRANSQDAMCVWHACDPWNTAAVQGLEGDGSPSHCTRTNKDGIDWVPAEGSGVETTWQIGDFYKSNRSHERQLSLYVTPQEHGGCNDCRFWTMCMGQCPGTAEESVDGKLGDWRLRSSYCQTWKDLFEEGERRLLEIGETPLSMHPKLKEIEQVMYQAWESGKEIQVGTAIRVVEGTMTLQQVGENAHGDHFDTGSYSHDDKHGDGHGDEHGNGHGDHMDNSHGPDSHGDHIDASILNVPHGDHTDTALLNVPQHVVPHGDHTDTALLNVPQHVVPHGDHIDTAALNVPHGDMHGDHIDALVLSVPHGDEHRDEHFDRGGKSSSSSKQLDSKQLGLNGQRLW